MTNLLNSSWGLSSPSNSYFIANLPDAFADFVTYTPRFQEVMETLDVFEQVVISGRVTDDLGVPVVGAVVEMWHPAKWGMFGMEFGPSEAPVDLEEQGWMSCVTNEFGEYSFKTEKRNSTQKDGLPSVNFKVTTEENEVKLAKLYFGQNQMQLTDPYLMDMEIEERYQCFGDEYQGVCEFDISF